MAVQALQRTHGVCYSTPIFTSLPPVFVAIYEVLDAAIVTACLFFAAGPLSRSPRFVAQSRRRTR